MVELVDTRDLKSLGHRLCRFKPGSGYQKEKAATGQFCGRFLLFRHRSDDTLYQVSGERMMFLSILISRTLSISIPKTFKSSRLSILRSSLSR